MPLHRASFWATRTWTLVDMGDRMHRRWNMYFTTNFCKALLFLIFVAL